MKIGIILASILASLSLWASIDELTIKGKIVRFDSKTVTIEIAGETYKFKRDKLGKQFENMKKGDTVDIVVDKSAEKNIEKSN